MADEYKIKITSEADAGGAKEITKAVKGIGDEAKNTSDRLDDVSKSLLDSIKATRDQASAVETSAKSTAKETSGNGTGLSITKGDVAAVTALSAVVGTLVYKIGDGVMQAANFAKELSQLPADQAQKLRDEMGPLADVIERNSAELIQFSENVDRAGGKVNEVFIRAGVQMVPVLEDISEAAANVDVEGVSDRMGAMGAGLLITFSQVRDALGNLAADTGLSKLNEQLNSLFFMQNQLNKLPAFVKSYNDEKANSPEVALKREQAAANKTAEAYALLDQERRGNAESNAPLADQLKNLQEQQDAALAAGNGKEALRLEGGISSVMKQIQAEKDAADKKKAADAAADAREREAETKRDGKAQQAVDRKKQELELEVQLAAAKAAGNTAEEKRLNWLKDYNSVLDATKGKADPNGDEGLAARVADSRSQRDQTSAIQLSSLAQRGGSVGESIAAAAASRQETLLREQATKTQQMVDSLRKVATRLDNPKDVYVRAK